MTPRYGASQHYLAARGEAYFAWQATLSPMARLVARKFAPFLRAGDTVVDFGSGDGQVLAALECGWKIGVEVNPAARASARARGLECFADLAELADGSADVVISNHALEHVPYPVHALEMMRRKLADGGRLVLVLPLDDWRTQRRYREDDLHRHLYAWTPQLLGNVLAEAGYPVRPGDIRIRRDAIHPRLVPLLERLPGPAAGAVTAATAILLRRRELFAAVPKCR